MTGRKHRKTYVPISGSNAELSGYQKKLKRKYIDSENVKLAKAAKKMFTSFIIPASEIPGDGEGESNTSDIQTASATIVELLEAISVENTETETPKANTTELGITDINKATSNTESNSIDVNDPVTWPNNLSAAHIETLVASGPKKTSLKEFTLHNGRAFKRSFFKGTKKNGEKYFRNWLVYSQKENSIFCFPCCVFPAHVSAIKHTTPWNNYDNNVNATCGFQDYFHTSRSIKLHEESKFHLESVTSWSNYKHQHSVVSSTKSLRNARVNEWRLILKGILDAVLFLSKQSLAFRGSTDNIQDHNCGNFLNLVKLLAKYYPPLASHVNKLEKKKLSYLSHDIQNEFIEICGKTVRNEIFHKVRQCKYFSIMFDSTPDSSKTDQLSQIVRVVECFKNDCFVSEYFIDFVHCDQKTGLEISELIVEKLKTDDINISNCRGQGYDNGSNMAGKYNGVQKYILDVNSKAVFVPCAAHSLNRVGVNAANRVATAKLILGQVQIIYNFFAGSTSRWVVLKKFVNVTVKPQSDTRWSSKANAVSPLCNQYGLVMESLTNILEDSDSTQESLAGADVCLKIMKSFKFLLGLVVWNSLLSKINLVNICLQTIGNDLSKAESSLKGLLNWIQKFRGTGFHECYNQAKKVADSANVGIKSGFNDVRPTRGKQNTSREGRDFQGNNYLKKFEVSFFNDLVDHVQSLMKERFVQIRDLNALYSFLWGKHLHTMSNEDKFEHVQDLCNAYTTDFDRSKFFQEIQLISSALSVFLPPGSTVSELGPLDVLKLIHRHELESAYPNIDTALRMFLTLTVTVASNERSFSKLKIIKNYLRSSMCNNRLSNLGILSIERELAASIDFDDIIKKFALAKCRKVKFKI